MRPNPTIRGRGDGYILVAVLGVMVVLTGFLAAGTMLMRSAVHAARVDNEDAAMAGLIEGGFELAAYQIFELKLPAPLVSGHRIKFGGGFIAPTIIDEGGKVDLNGSDPKLLQSEMEAVGLDIATSRAVVARIVALRGPDPKAASQDLAQSQAPTGTEASTGTQSPTETQAQTGSIFAPPSATTPSGLGKAPRLRGFQSVDALGSFPEIDRAAYRLLEARFTVFNPDGKIDIVTAAPDVMIAIPGMDKGTVERIVARRRDAAKAELENLAASLGSARDYIKVSSGPAYTVQIDATAADGRKKSVGAVMADAKSPDVPYYVLEWQD